MVHDASVSAPASDDILISHSNFRDMMPVAVFLSAGNVAAPGRSFVASNVPLDYSSKSVSAV